MASTLAPLPILEPLARPDEIQQDPKAFREHFQRGVEFYEVALNEQALSEFESALTYRPDEAEAHYGRGLALARLGRYEEALTALDRTVYLNPTLAKAHAGRAAVLGLLARSQDALDAAARLLELRPADPTAYADQGTHLAVLGRYKEALASFDRAVALGLSSRLTEDLLPARAQVLRKVLRGLGVRGGGKAWMGKSARSSIGARQPLILKPGSPTVSEAVVEDRR